MPSRSDLGPPKAGFTRRLVYKKGRTLIESTCTHCGFVILGSVSGELPQQEADHLEQQHGRAAAAAEEEN